MAQEPPTSADITAVLSNVAEGDPGACNELMSLVYDQLKAIARARMARENPEHTLQATALVHEAFLKIMRKREVSWSSRCHFYGCAAEAMRRILLDHAKARGRQKRSGHRRKLPINVVDLAAEQDSSEIVALDEALCRLGEVSPEAANVVRLRFYAGLSIDETAQALELSPRTVDRRWKYARAWLFRMLTEPMEKSDHDESSAGDLRTGGRPSPGRSRQGD